MEGSTKTFDYVSNGSRSDDERQGMDFRRVADTVPAFILVADADGKVLYMFFGITPETQQVCF